MKPRDLLAMRREPLVLDVREPEEWAAGHRVQADTPAGQP